MERIAPRLDAASIHLEWHPLDMSQLLSPYRRGQPMPDQRRENAMGIAKDLGVEVQAPAFWNDSRAAAAAAIALAGTNHEATWRERVFCAVFEERREAPSESTVTDWLCDLGFAVPGTALTLGRETLAADTERAREAMVSGVPTFMLGEWPVGGIQTGETMVHLLGRYAEKRRSGAVR